MKEMRRTFHRRRSGTVKVETDPAEKTLYLRSEGNGDKSMPQGFTMTMGEARELKRFLDEVFA